MFQSCHLAPCKSFVKVDDSNVPQFTAFVSGRRYAKGIESDFKTDKV